MPDIEGATGLSYTPTAADVGMRLRYREKVTGPGGESEWAYSEWSPIVQADAQDRRSGGSSALVSVAAVGAGQKLEQGDPTDNFSGGSIAAVGVAAVGAGTKDEAYTQVTVYASDEWSGPSGGSTNALQTTAPAGSAGKTGLLFAASQSGMTFTDLPGWTLVNATTASDPTAYVWKRDMDGSATDSPLLDPDSTAVIRNALMVVLNDTTAANVAAADAWYGPSPSAEFVDVAALTTTVDSSLILSACVVTYELRTVIAPLNMTLVEQNPAYRRSITVASKAMPNDGTFDPDNFTWEGDSSSTAITCSFVAAPAAAA